MHLLELYSKFYLECGELHFPYLFKCKGQRLKFRSLATIIAVECGDPGKPTNGRQIVKKGYVYGGSVKFVCDKNYTLVGADVIYCQANRSWSSSVPRCLGKCHG